MARSSERQVIDWLECVALIEPTNEASVRAIGRAREALAHRQPLLRNRYARRTVAAVGCAAALAMVLIAVFNRFVHDGPDRISDPAPDRLAQSVPATKTDAFGGDALPFARFNDLRHTVPDSQTQYNLELDSLPNNCLKLQAHEGDAVLLALIERLPKTSWVNLEGSRVTDAGLAHLKLLKDLNRVGLDRAQATAEGIRHLQALPGLKFLEVHRATNDSVAQLKELKGLTQLGLSYSAELTDEALAYLANRPFVNLFLTNDSQIGDAGLAHLKGLTELQELNLNHTAITDEGLEHLRGLKHLERLDLGGTSITDAGLRHLANLTSLKELQLGNTRVTDAGLAHLEKLTNIWSLGLYQLPVTDAGMEHLKPLKKLMVLGLKGTQVSDAAVEKLRQGLPHAAPSTFGER